MDTHQLSNLSGNGPGNDSPEGAAGPQPGSAARATPSDASTPSAPVSLLVIKRSDSTGESSQPYSGDRDELLHPGGDLIAEWEKWRAARLGALGRRVGARTPEQEKTKRPSRFTRQQKRIFQRAKSLLFHWEGCNYDVLWVVLTTAVGGDAKALAYHHKMLRNRIERELGFAELEFLHVQTGEGNGVLHVMWAWKLPPGAQRGTFYVEHSWLSQQWKEIHGAPYVYIKRYRAGGASAQRISQYLVSQYVSNQSALVRVSWSRLRSLDFPLSQTWYDLKSTWRQEHADTVPFPDFIRAWESMLLHGTCQLGDTTYGIRHNMLMPI